MVVGLTRGPVFQYFNLLVIVHCTLLLNLGNFIVFRIYEQATTHSQFALRTLKGQAKQMLSHVTLLGFKSKLELVVAKTVFCVGW